MTAEKKTTRILTYEGVVCPWEEWVHMVENQPLSATYRNGCRKKVNMDRKLLITIVNTQEYFINYERLCQFIWTYTSNIWVLKGFYKVSHSWGKVQSEMVLSQEHYSSNYLDCLERLKSTLILEKVLSRLVQGQCLLMLQLGLPKLRILLL